MKKIKIAVFTGTRAEYGLLYPLLKKIEAEPRFELQLIVSGTHLSPEFGNTVNDIVSDGFAPAAEVDMLLSSDRPSAIGKSLGLGVIGLTDSLERLNSGCVIILGDRFEALAMAQAAMIMRVPIIHLHGGEISEGAIDDVIRHSITKLACLHFTSTKEHRKRVIQMGELPCRVFDVGSLAVENINSNELLHGEALNKSLGFKLQEKNILVTYHPVTMSEENSMEGIHNMLAALETVNDASIVITFPNADSYGRDISSALKSFAARRPTQVLLTESLGRVRYLSTMKASSFVLGNSSSGLIEAPILGVPTINIGDRQKGRFAPSSVLHCSNDAADIQHSIFRLLKEPTTFIPSLEYGQGNTSASIIKIISKSVLSKLLPKPFFDISFNVSDEN